jgi:hypothetical protein
MTERVREPAKPEPHSRAEPKLEGDIWIASFDIGIKNFAFWVEKYSSENVNDLRKKYSAPTYSPDGTASQKTQEMLELIYTSGQCIIFENNALTDEKKATVNRDTLCSLTELLDQHALVFDKCDYFVVEKQMAFGKFRNPKAIHLSHHVMSYFYIRHGRLANIVEFPAYHKTQVLGAQKKQMVKKGKRIYKAIDKPSRKKWAVEKAQDILFARLLRSSDEEYSLMHLADNKKKDDVSDCLLQAIAFFILHILTLPSLQGTSILSSRGKSDK